MLNLDDAVSEAIAGVLLIALVLIGFSIVGLYITSNPLPEKVPNVQFSIRNGSSSSPDDLVLIHEGGEELRTGSFYVMVDEIKKESGSPSGYSVWNSTGAGAVSWRIGDRVVIPNCGGAKRVALVYSGGSGDTALRSIYSPGGFYVFPSRDADERIDVPTPNPTTYPWPPWNQSRPITWPGESGIDPSEDTVIFDESKIAYVAAHDSSNPSGYSPLFVCDGSDDESQINDALSMVRGGTVILLDGSFHCSDRIRVPGHTNLTGQNSTLTHVEILAPSGQSGYLPVTLNEPDVTVQGFSLYGNGFVMVTTSRVRVRDIVATNLELDNPSERRRASGNGMFFVWATTGDLQDIEFYRCTAHTSNTHGFNINQYWSLGGPETQGKTIGWIRLVFCNAIRCGFGEPAGSRSEWITGFDLHEWQDLRHLEVLNCTAVDNWESGFHLEPGGRYDGSGAIIAPRTISEDITFRNCTSGNNGWRNTHSGAFFLSGFYLSRDTHMTDCHSINNRNAGYYVHGGDSSDFTRCTDDGSTYGWKVCKDSSNIGITDCISRNNLRWALWISFSRNVHVRQFQHYNVVGDRGYQNNLGWYKDETKYQQPVTESSFQITAFGNGMPIINRVGSGNDFDLSFG